MDIVLRPGEEIVRQFSISRRLFILLIVVGLILAVGLPVGANATLAVLGIELNATTLLATTTIGILVGAALVIYAFYFRAARHYLITTERVVQTVGLFSKRTVFAEFDDITDISIHQDIFERLILGIGRVEINTAGSEAEEIQFERIGQPYQIATQIRELCAKHFASNGHRGHAPTVIDRTGAR